MIELNTENHVGYNLWSNVLKDVSYNASDGASDKVWKNFRNLGNNPHDNAINYFIKNYNILKNVQNDFKFNILKDSQNHTKLK